MIETPRLILRPPVMNDAVEITLAKQAVWPELQRWMSWAYAGHETLESTYAFIASATKDDTPLAGFCKKSGRFVISTGLHQRHGRFETGYWVAPDFLGRGYATESTNAILRYAFAVRKEKAVYIDYLQGNEKSRRVIEKLGFTPLEIKPKACVRPSDGAQVDEHWYVMRDPAALPPLDVKWRQGP